MNWAAACWAETKLSCSWRPTSSKVNRWARLGREQQRRVQWVRPRSEICGGSFKGQREQRKKSNRTRAKPLWALTNNDLNQEFTSSHSKVLGGAGLCGAHQEHSSQSPFCAWAPCARILALKKRIRVDFSSQYLKISASYEWWTDPLRWHTFESAPLVSFFGNK